MSGLISRAMEVTHDRDPAEVICEEVAPYIDGVRIGGPDVLIAVYKRDGRTKIGNLILPDKTKDEDDFQGVSGLVLKLGPLAYNTEKTKHWFTNKDGDPAPPKVGDWVMFDTKVSLSFLLGPRTCRFVNDQYIRGILDRPDMVA